MTLLPDTADHVRDLHDRRTLENLAVLAATKGVIVASLKHGNDSLEAMKARAHLHSFDSWPMPGRRGE